MPGIFFAYCRLLTFIKFYIQNILSRNTLKMLNTCSLFTDQDRHSVGPDLGPNVYLRRSVGPDLDLNYLQRLSANDNNRH